MAAAHGDRWDSDGPSLSTEWSFSSLLQQDPEELHASQWRIGAHPPPTCLTYCLYGGSSTGDCDGGKARRWRTAKAGLRRATTRPQVAGSVHGAASGATAGLGHGTICSSWLQISSSTICLPLTRPQGNWCHEYRKLKAKVETIQKCQKHLMGEDLESLNLKELQQLEQQLESSLKHIRSRKSQLMHESISELQKKEGSLQEENKILQKELAEKQKAHTQQAQWEQTQPQTSSSSSSFMMGEAPPATNFSNPPVAAAAAIDRAEDAAVQPQARTGLPAWMVSHINNG